MRNETVGIALPITCNMLKNLEKREKAVFFKFMPHESLPKQLRLGDLIFFYISKKIVGAARIKKISLMRPQEIIKLYSKDILINLREFTDYTELRKEKKALVLTLEKIKMYKKLIDLDFYVTMGGRYIFDREYKSWLKK